jgi:uncharacterized protein
MKFSNESIRRQDRLLDEAKSVLLLKQGEYGVLSMIAEGSEAYGIPLNFVWDNNSSVYLHCATEGRKLQCLEVSNKVSFCVVGKTNIVSNKFSTEYESIILNCLAYTKLPVVERMKALELILDKYSPADKEIGMKYAEKSFDRTEIIRLDIQEWSGKCKSIQ